VQKVLLAITMLRPDCTGVRRRQLRSRSHCVLSLQGMADIPGFDGGKANSIVGCEFRLAPAERDAPRAQATSESFQMTADDGVGSHLALRARTDTNHIAHFSKMVGDRMAAFGARFLRLFNHWLEVAESARLRTSVRRRCGSPQRSHLGHAICNGMATPCSVKA
jgi:hypothetical protein